MRNAIGKSVCKEEKAELMPPGKNGNGGNGMMVPISICAAIIMALLQAFWGVAWSGINANLDRIERQTGIRISAVEHEFLRLREHDEFTRRLDSQITKIESKLADGATRSELDTRLGINSNSLIQVRAELDILKRDLGQTYNVKDALAAYQARLDRIEQRFSVIPTATTK